MQSGLRQPFALILTGVGMLAMLAPAAYGFGAGEFGAARIFVSNALLLALGLSLFGIALSRRGMEQGTGGHLIALVYALTGLPLILALPMWQITPEYPLAVHYFEMVSSITTTGAGFIPAAELGEAQHFWRVIVGWGGGFLMWIAAFAIFAPLNIGGFEVYAAQAGAGVGYIGSARGADGGRRLRRFAARLAPAYLGITAALWILLALAGETGFVALTHAMSTISTSGISAVGGIAGGQTGRLGEFLVFMFLFFAVTHVTFRGEPADRLAGRLRGDRELKLAIGCVLIIPATLFLTHFLTDADRRTLEGVVAGLEALWGSAFMVLSFLTTTGFESADWSDARGWSGVPVPGLVLAGIALMGGGVATTAGGIKLMRIYALYKHGVREMQKLAFPSSVGGAGAQARRLRRQGAYVAWIFFMLFVISLAGVMALLSLGGIAFEDSLVLGIAALSTTGPLAAVAGPVPLDYTTLGTPAQAVLASAMVLGRVETLGILALLNPDFWR